MRRPLEASAGHAVHGGARLASAGTGDGPQTQPAPSPGQPALVPLLLSRCLQRSVPGSRLTSCPARHSSPECPAAAVTKCQCKLGQKQHLLPLWRLKAQPPGAAGLPLRAAGGSSPPLRLPGHGWPLRAPQEACSLVLGGLGPPHCGLVSEALGLGPQRTQSPCHPESPAPVPLCAGLPELRQPPCRPAAPGSVTCPTPSFQRAVRKWPRGQWQPHLGCVVYAPRGSSHTQATSPPALRAPETSRGH